MVQRKESCVRMTQLCLPMVFILLKLLLLPYPCATHALLHKPADPLPVLMPLLSFRSESKSPVNNTCVYVFLCY